MPHAGGRPRKWPVGMTRAEVRRIRRQQRRLAPARPQSIPVTIRQSMLAAAKELSEKHQCDYLGEVHKQLLESAKNGNIAAIREVYDRLEGKPTQAVTLQRNERESLAVQTLRQMPKDVAFEQLDAAMRQIQELRKELLADGEAVDVKANELPEGTQTHTAGPESEWPEFEGFDGITAIEAHDSGDSDVLECQPSTAD